MDLRDKIVALSAMRHFVRKLTPDQRTLFHQIAARYQGSAETFASDVLDEFKSETRQTPRSTQTDALTLAAFRQALGRDTRQVGLVADDIIARWNSLHPRTQETIQGEIETAISYGEAGSSHDVACWARLRKLPAAPMPAEVPHDLADLRSAAAQEAYEAFDFGNLVVEDHDGWEHTTPGEEWTRAIYIQPEQSNDPTVKGQFTVRFARNSAIVAESYAALNGNPIEQATLPTP